MPRYEPFDWYEQPLDHDIIFDADTDSEADFLHPVHQRRARSRGRRVLEPACGSGRPVATMTRRGYRVTGLDLSQAVLRFARQCLKQQKLNATLHHATRGMKPPMHTDAHRWDAW